MDDTVESLKAALAVERARADAAEKELATGDARAEAAFAAFGLTLAKRAEWIARAEKAESALAVEKAARERAEALLLEADRQLASGFIRCETCGGQEDTADMDVRGVIGDARAALASPSESAPQPTPETRVDEDMAALEGAIEDAEFYNPSGDYSRAHDALARRAAPTGQQQEAGALANLRTKRDRYNADGGYDLAHVLEALDAFLDAPAAAPPSAPQEGLFKEGWEAGRDAAAEHIRWIASLGETSQYIADVLRKNAAHLASLVCPRRALPLPESALLTKAAPAPVETRLTEEES